MRSALSAWCAETLQKYESGERFSLQMSGKVLPESGQADGLIGNEIRKMKGGRGFV